MNTRHFSFVHALIGALSAALRRALRSEAPPTPPAEGGEMRIPTALRTASRRGTLRRAMACVAIIGSSSIALADSQSGSRTTNVNIPDATASGPGAWVSSTITISGAPAGATVTGIDVSFGCIHTYSGDLYIDVNADINGNLGNYRLWNREGGSADNPTRSTSGIHTYDGLSVNRTWYLYARDNAPGDTGYIDQWSITVHYATPPPSAPSSLVAVGSSNDVLVQWQDNATNEDGFRIERRTGTNGSWNLLTTVPASSGTGTDGYEDDGLSFGNTYYYRVNAYNSAGTSAFSNLASATTLATPSLTLPANGSTVSSPVTLQWNGVIGAELYGIDLGNSCGSTTILNNQASTSTSYNLALPNGTYFFRIRAANGTSPGISTVSACRSFTVGTPPQPTAAWITPRPASVVSGSQFSVAFSITGNPSHVNIHWDPSNPLAAGCCTSANTTSDSTFSPTSSPVALTAPTLNVNGSPITTPTTVQYVVHVTSSAGAGNSAIVSTTIQPTGSPDIRLQPQSVDLSCCPNCVTSPPDNDLTLGVSAQAAGTEDDAALPPRPCTILMPDGVFGPRSVYVANTWPNGVVPYAFHANVSAAHRQQAEAAMMELESVANVDFVPRGADADYLFIQDSTANNSFVGRQGGSQVVNIFNWNVRFIMVHEFMHALGFWHEQQRSDRDQFVQVNLAAVQPGYADQFTPVASATPFGAYDFDSVMHYAGCDLSVCCPIGSTCACATACQTISVLPPNQSQQNVIGQRDHFSTGDVQGLRHVYGDPISLPDSGCFTVFNDGPVALQVSSITRPSWATLSPAPPFSVPANGFLQVCIEACGSCNGSDMNGSLAVNSNDPDEPSVAVNVHVDCPSVTVAPVIDSIPDATIQALTAYTGPTPALVQGTLPVNWTLAVGPPGMAIGSNSGVVSWPSATSAGSPHQVTIRATNGAGSDTESWVLSVTPQPCDSIDFNNDGLLPDTQDIADFLLVFGGGACPTGTCGDVDFNNDGLFPDTTDIQSLLVAFSGGACP